MGVLYKKYINVDGDNFENRNRFIEEYNIVKYHPKPRIKIREQKYKDVIDRMLNVIDQNLYGDYKKLSDSIMMINKNNTLQDYLNKNPNSSQVDFMNSKAIIVKEDKIRKLFFLDEKNIMSFDIIVSGENSHIVKTCFNELISSIMVKRKNFKKIF